jgi:hypothetical protein
MVAGVRPPAGVDVGAADPDSDSPRQADAAFGGNSRLGGVKPR